MKRQALISALLSAVLWAVPQASSARSIKATVIPVQFPDLRFSVSEAAMDSVVNAAAAYWQEEFCGKASVSISLVSPVTLARTYKYYGANSSDRNDALAYVAVKEACQAVGTALDFSKAGELIFIVPGKSEADAGDPDLFWPQYASLEDRKVFFYMNGRRITGYAIVNELGADGGIAGIGTLCHEFGHLLGLPDFYDTDGEGSGGKAKCLWGSIALMDKGNENDGGHTPPHLSAIERWCLDAGEAIVPDTSGTYTLEPVHRHGSYLQIAGSSSNEIYLLENRRAEGRDAFIGGQGLLMYRIDKSSRPAGYSTYYQEIITAAQRWRYNHVNCNPEHQCGAIVPAEEDAASVAEVFYTTDGPSAPLNISGISFAADGTASFTVSRPLVLGSVRVFQSEAILNWKTDPAAGRLDSCSVAISAEGEDIRSNFRISSSGNSHGAMLSPLKPKTAYHYTIKAYYDGDKAYSLEGDFTTLAYRSGSFPFIYLSRDGRDGAGRFTSGTHIPLTVFNAPDAVRTEWFFDGIPVVPDSEGLFIITQRGILRAVVYREDGSVDILEKEVQTR